MDLASTPVEVREVVWVVLPLHTAGSPQCTALLLLSPNAAWVGHATHWRLSHNHTTQLGICFLALQSLQTHPPHWPCWLQRH